MKKLLVLILGLSMIVAISGQAFAVAIVDVVEANTGFFVPTDAQKFDSPYYRAYNQNWGWTHSGIAGTFSTADLSISAFDVDASSGEVDEIEIFNEFSGTWDPLGTLAGGNNIWSYTTFALDLTEYTEEINNGLQVRMLIDTGTQGSWLVTLAKSVLNLDGGTIPEPEPGAQVPEPATFLLFGFGLAGLAGFKKRFK